MEEGLILHCHEDSAAQCGCCDKDSKKLMVLLLIWGRGCEKMYSSFSHPSFPLHVFVCIIDQFENCPPLEIVYTRNSSMDWNLGCAPFFPRTSTFQVLVIYVTTSAEPFVPPFLLKTEGLLEQKKYTEEDTSSLLLCLPSHVPMEEHSAVGSTVLLLVLEKTVCSVLVFLFPFFSLPSSCVML